LSRAQNGNYRGEAAARGGARSAAANGTGGGKNQSGGGGGFCSLVFKLLLGLMVAGAAAMISMLW
jgi:hypothetical protein